MPKPPYKRMPARWEEKFREQIEHWKNVPWEEKHSNPAYVRFEEERAAAQRAEIGKLVFEQRLAALKAQEKKLGAELKKPWRERSRNKSIAIRGIQFVMNIAELPFEGASIVAGFFARPISWINEQLLGKKSYIMKEGKIPLEKGTSRRDFFGTLFAERRDLARIRSQIKKLEAKK